MDWSKKLYKLLSSYQIQEDTTKFNVQNLSDWGQSNKNQGLFVNENNFQQFLQILQKYNFSGTEILENSFYNHRTINEVLKLTLKDKPVTKYENGNEIIIKANLVKLSDIKLSICQNTAKSAAIFVSDTIYIDADFKVNNFNLTIASPNWYINGKRIIDLSGADAENVIPSKAPSGTTLGAAGTKGEPGLPGRAGGVFLGIGENFINGNNLSIIANGGKGGKGQDGGDGAPGINGQDANYDGFDNFQHEKVGSIRWKIFGREGGKGGNGGNGGHGGLGGNPGKVDIFSVGEKSNITIKVNRGSDGFEGTGGFGGIGGLNGDHLEANYFICCWSASEAIPNPGLGLKGNDGESNANNEGMLFPEERNVTNPAWIINNYKFFLRHILLTSNPYRREENFLFLKKLTRSSDIMGVGGVIQDFDNLETQFLSLSKRVHLFAFYEELLKAVERLGHDSNLNTEKETLMYLYTAILSKLNLIEEDILDSSIVVKIKEYRENASEQMKHADAYSIRNNYSNISLDGLKQIVESLLNFVNSFVVNKDHSRRLNYNQSLETASRIMENIVVDFTKLIKPLGNILEKTKKTFNFSTFSKSGKQLPSLGDIAEVVLLTGGLESELELWKASYTDKLLGLLGNMKKVLKDLELKTKKGETPYLDILEWQVPQVLKDIKLIFKQIIKDSHVEAEMSNLLEALNIVINVFRRLESYYRRKRLSDYLEKIDFHSEKTGIIEKLKTKILLNLILGTYERNVDMIRQYRFPHVKLYYESYKLNTYLLRQSNVTDLTGKVSSKLDFLHYQNYLDEYIMNGHFSGRNGPFYEWDAIEFRESISKLFEGKEIALKADLNRSPRKNNAITFKLVELNFNAVNETIQTALDTTLGHFDVKLKHIGNSYYRCDNKTYLITTGPFTFTYDYRKTSEGVPVSKNGVYELFSQGEAILSPYTTWILSLENRLGSDNDFKLLKEFVGLVSLELVGKGRYLLRSPYPCDHDVDKYYEIEAPLEMSSHGRQGRFRREIQESYGSSGSQAISPINTAFKWITSTLVSSIRRIEHLGGLASKQSPLSLGEPCNYYNTVVDNPLIFFHQIDFILILAPVLVCYFHQRPVTPPRGKKKTTVRIFRKKTWTAILKRLSDILNSYRLKAEWISENLEDRFEEIQEINLTASDEKLNLFEKRLIYILVDFLDAIRYDMLFKEVKRNENFLYDVNKLIELYEAVPGFYSDLANLSYEL